MLDFILLWHQHQPRYRDPFAAGSRGVYRLPWVRLHALRDYFGMAARLWESPEMRCAVNLTPVLLDQLADYRAGCTDRLWELTRDAPAGLSAPRRLELLRDGFDADWERQVGIHPRYAELLERYGRLSGQLGELDLWRERSDPRLDEFRARAAAMPRRDIIDLAVWINLAWFPVELRRAGWVTPWGEELSVAGLIEKDRDFDAADIAELGRVQARVLEAVPRLHRLLAETGRIELSATPYAHPILPLLIDSDLAIIDREGSVHPARYARPAEGRRHIERGLAVLERELGTRPRGWWPAEGSVGQCMIDPLAEAGARWAATDEGVLAPALGREPTGMDLALPRLVHGEHGEWRLFFRDHALSDAIGFHYSRLSPEKAVGDLLWGLRQRYAEIERGCAMVILDGENAWGAYPDDGRDFLLRLYAELAAAEDIRPLTPGVCLDGLDADGVACPVLDELPHASWIDEFGSAPGNDLGTWIGEPEENAAWDALRVFGERLDALGITPRSHPEVYDHLDAAQGSDWFWWYGTDQATAPKAEREFDRLFRDHLRAAWRAAGLEPPAELDRPIAGDYCVWTPSDGDVTILSRTRLFIQLDGDARRIVLHQPDGSSRELTPRPLGGVMGLPTCHRAEVGYVESGRYRLEIDDRTYMLRVERGEAG